MTFANNLKTIVDLPVWEWMRFAPASAVAGSTIAGDWNVYYTGGTPRYAYYMVGGVLYRYDTYTDSWHTLSTSANSTNYAGALVYNPSQGYYGKAIGPGPGSNTIQMAALTGATLVGYKIMIYAGSGAGQERTITSVAEPLVHDSGFATTYTVGPPALITDASNGASVKTWKWSQWRDYQLRLTVGTGQNQVRRVLYNTATSLYFSDYAYANVHPWYAPPLATAASSANTFYQIESSIVNVNSNWDIPPDSTSRFVVKGGGLWYASGINSGAYYTLSYYDILSDVWYMKGTQTPILLSNNLSTYDLSLECCGECEGGTTTNGACATPLATNLGVISATAAPYNTRTLIDAGQNMPINRYANMMIRLTGGTGKGQTRAIIANNTTTFIIGRDWDVVPDSTTTYQVIGDSDKLYMLPGRAQSVMGQYSVETDVMTTGRQFDYGVARTFSVTLAPYGIAGAVIGAGNGGSGYAVGDILTLTTNTPYTGTGGKVKVATVSGSAVVTVTIVTAGANYIASTAAYSTTSGNEGGGSGSGCIITVTANTTPSQPAIGVASIARVTGSILTVTINAAGTGYNVNDLLTLSGGGANSLIRVTGVTPATGAVTSISLESQGSGYSPLAANGVAIAAATAHNTSATGLTITTTITDSATVTTSINHNFSIGDIVVIGGSDALSTNTSSTYYGGIRTVTGVLALTTFSYSIGTGAQISYTVTGGVITTLTGYTAAGTGYSTGTGLATVAIGAGGSGYNVGDLLQVGGGTGGIVKVATLSGSAVATVTIAAFGSGYTASTTQATVNLGNTPLTTSGGSSLLGTGCTITVSTIGNVYSISAAGGAMISVTGVNATGGVTSAVIANGGTGYTNGTLNLTPQGGAAIFNAEALSTVLLIDTTKNWVANELVGKTLSIGLYGPAAAFQTRRIVANTSHSISVGLAMTLPVSGTYKYVIHDPKPLGTESTNKSDPRQYAWGMATSGSTTSLTDAPTGLGSVAVAVGGTGYNVNDVLTLTTGGTGGTVKVVSVTPATSGAVTAVAIVTPGSGYGVGSTSTTSVVPSGGSGCTITVSYLNTKNWAINQWAGKKVKIIAGKGVDSLPNEALIASNNATTLTLTTNWAFSAAPDTTTVYAIMDNWGTATGAGLSITTATASTPGSGYSVGDIIWVNGGTAVGCFIKVLTLSSGGVATFTILNPGSGFTNTTFSTVCLTSTGSGCVITAGATQTTAGSATVLNDPFQNWGAGGATGSLVTKEVRFLSGSNPGTEYAITQTAATQLTYASGSTADGNTQYGVYGVLTRGNTNTAATNGGVSSLIRLFGTTVIDKARYLISWRGNGTPTIDRYDITQDMWEFLTQSPLTETYAIGSMFEYNGKDRIYLTKDITGRIMYYDLAKNIIVPCSTVPYGMSTGIQGNRMFTISTTDLLGANLEYLYVMRHNGTEMWRSLIFW